MHLQVIETSLSTVAMPMSFVSSLATSFTSTSTTATTGMGAAAMIQTPDAVSGSSTGSGDNSGTSVCVLPALADSIRAQLSAGLNISADWIQLKCNDAAPPKQASLGQQAPPQQASSQQASPQQAPSQQMPPQQAGPPLPSPAASLTSGHHHLLRSLLQSTSLQSDAQKKASDCVASLMFVLELPRLVTITVHFQVIQS